MTIVKINPNGFWWKNKFVSKDGNGKIVYLTKKEYKQMQINSKVLIVGVD